MNAEQSRKYDPAFERNVVLLAEDPMRTGRDVAETQGIGVDLLYQWRKRYRRHGEITFPRNGKTALTHEQQRAQELEKRLYDAEMLLYILIELWPSPAGHRSEIITPFLVAALTTATNESLISNSPYLLYCLTALCEQTIRPVARHHP